MANRLHLGGLGNAFEELYELTGGRVSVNMKKTYSPDTGTQSSWVVSYLGLDKWEQVSSTYLIDALQEAVSNIKRHDPLEVT